MFMFCSELNRRSFFVITHVHSLPSRRDDWSSCAVVGLVPLAASFGLTRRPAGAAAAAAECGGGGSTKRMPMRTS